MYNSINYRFLKVFYLFTGFISLYALMRRRSVAIINVLNNLCKAKVHMFFIHLSVLKLVDPKPCEEKRKVVKRIGYIISDGENSLLEE